MTKFKLILVNENEIETYVLERMSKTRIKQLYLGVYERDPNTGIGGFVKDIQFIDE